MRRKKCNICNEECAEYLFGLPNFEAIQDDLDNGKIVLGGCCISIPSPKWHCKSCCIDYYSGGYGEWSKDSFYESLDFDIDEEDVFEKSSFSELPENIRTFLLEVDNLSIKDLNFAFRLEIGGYTSFEQIEYYFIKNILIKYVSESPIPRYRESIPDGVYILNKDQIHRIRVFLDNSTWDRHYQNNEVIDGTEWNLEVKIKGSFFKSYGHMQFPGVYEEFKSILEEIASYNSLDDLI